MKFLWTRKQNISFRSKMVGTGIVNGNETSKIDLKVPENVKKHKLTISYEMSKPT